MNEKVRGLVYSLLTTVAFLLFPVSWGWGLIILLFPCSILFFTLRRTAKQPLWLYCLFGLGLIALFDGSEAFLYGRFNYIFLSYLADVQTVGLIIFAIAQVIFLMRVSTLLSIAQRHEKA